MRRLRENPMPQNPRLAALHAESLYL